MASTLMNHDVYIWERGLGSLVKILEGPKEELGAVEVNYKFDLHIRMTANINAVASYTSIRRSNRC